MVSLWLLLLIRRAVKVESHVFHVSHQLKPYCAAQNRNEVVKEEEEQEEKPLFSFLLPGAPEVFPNKDVKRCRSMRNAPRPLCGRTGGEIINPAFGFGFLKTAQN